MLLWRWCLWLCLWCLSFFGGAGLCGGGGGGGVLGRGAGGGGGGGVGVEAVMDTPLLPMETLIQFPAITGADDSSTEAAIERRVSLRFIICLFNVFISF